MEQQQQQPSSASASDTTTMEHPLSSSSPSSSASSAPPPAPVAPVPAAPPATTAPESGVEGQPAVPQQQPQSQLSADAGGAKPSSSSSSLKQEFLKAAPRDATHGVAAGVKSIAMGVGVGVGALVGLPIAGAQSEGVKGFFKGLGAGVLSAVAAPVAGVVTGVMEIGGGLANTPSAVSARLEGRTWDPIQRQWVRYSLAEEAARVTREEEAFQNELKQQQRAAAAAAAGVGGGKAAAAKRVKETRLYDLLGVAPDASAEDVKKAYYKAARRCHPDKNPGDAAAHEKFQQLSQAYQVLSNDQLRAAYDRDGEEAAAVADTPFIDPSVFFNVLFGSEKFEPYVGRLKLSTMASALGDMFKSAEAAEAAAAAAEGEGEEGKRNAAAEALLSSGAGGMMDGERSARVQNLREVNIATHLAHTVLAPFVAGDREAFHAWMTQEAAALAQGAFGPQMLVEVGWAYESTGREYLGYADSFLGVEGWLERFAREAKGIGRQVGVAGAAVSAIRAAKGIHDSLPKESLEGDDGGEGKEKEKGKTTTTTPGAGAGAAGGSGGGDGGSEPAPPPSAAAAASGGGSEEEEEAAKARQQREQEREQRRMQEAERAMQENLPTFVQLMWRMSALDVQKTVARASRKTVKDTSVPDDVRRRRAQGLVLLGAHFQSVGKQALAAEAAKALEAGGGAPASKGEAAARQLEEAMQRAMAVSQGQEI